jgi:hypothetical protein
MAAAEALAWIQVASETARALMANARRRRGPHTSGRERKRYNGDGDE